MKTGVHTPERNVKKYMLSKIFPSEQFKFPPVLKAMLCYVLIALFSYVSLFHINAGQIAATVAVLTYARNYRCSGGFAAGMLAAAVLVPAYGSEGILLSVLFTGLAGVTAGTFTDYGRPAAAAAYMITYMTGKIVSGSGAEKIYSLICTAIGTIIFCFIPVEKLYTKECIESNPEETNDMIRLMSFRMRMAAQSLITAGNILISSGTETTDHLNESRIKHLYRTVCEKCSRKNYCWGTRNETTYNAFVKASSLKVSDSSGLPKEFDYCFKKENIADELRNNISSQIAEITANEYLRMSRRILSGQLQTSSELLKYLSFDITSKYTVDRRMTERMKKCFIENDIGFSSVVAYYNSGRRLFAEVYCTKNACISGYRIYKVLSDEFGKNFECTKYYDGDEMRFLISERPQYNVETYISQKSSSGTGPNGDTCDCFRDDYGNVYLVISDGMGTGSEAAECSETAAAVFKKLILGGVEISQSIHIVNSVMMTRGTDECFATLDIAKFDLDSGNMTIYKSGAAPTIFKHESSVFSVSSSSYPLGISETPGPYSKCFPLKVNDTVAMFSDGVPEDAYRVIKRELLKHDDVGDISGNICKSAKELSSDDISVIVAKLIRQ